jgi:hypothetical protein
VIKQDYAWTGWRGRGEAGVRGCRDRWAGAQAPHAHLFTYAEFVGKREILAAASPPGTVQLYPPITPADTLSNCCGHLLTAVGLEIMYPADAERMRRARSGRR